MAADGTHRHIETLGCMRKHAMCNVQASIEPRCSGVDHLVVVDTQAQTPRKLATTTTITATVGTPPPHVTRVEHHRPHLFGCNAGSIEFIVSQITPPARCHTFSSCKSMKPGTCTCSPRTLLTSCAPRAAYNTSDSFACTHTCVIIFARGSSIEQCNEGRFQ
jgi:hypothetical protein